MTYINPAISWLNYDIANQTHGNKFQWNFNLYSYIFIENVFNDTVVNFRLFRIGLHVLRSMTEAIPFYRRLDANRIDVNYPWTRKLDTCFMRQ